MKMYSAGLPAYAPSAQHRLPDYPQPLQPAPQSNWIWPSASPTMTRSHYQWPVEQSSTNNNIPSGYCYSPYPPGSSSDHTYKTHMITDILKAQNSEIAKVPSNYQNKSPTGTGAHVYTDVSRSLATGELLSSRPINGYGHCPQPVIPRFPDSFFPSSTGYETATCTAREVNHTSTQQFVDISPPIMPHSNGTIPMFSPPIVNSIPSLSPSGITSPRSLPQLKDIHQSVEDEKKKPQKKGRPTFSGTQITELEKAFQASQYLSTHDRHILAERLGLSENQIKIWFQNRRTKCRRTAWKSRSPTCKMPTTPTSPTTPTTPSTPSSCSSSPSALSIKLPPLN